MKKLLALLLAAVMLLTLCACGKKEEKPAEETKPTYGTPPAEDIATVAEQFVVALCTQDKLTVFDLFCYDALQQWKDKELAQYDKTEAEYCAEAQAQADEQGLVLEYAIDTMEDYLAAGHEVDAQYKLEAYGAYTIRVEAFESTRMTEQEVADWRAVVLSTGGDYASEEAVNTITEIHNVKVRFIIEGEKKTKNETYLVYVANFQGEWRVAGHST